MNLEHNENVANTAEERSTVLVLEDFDDMNSASTDSLSPDLGEVWRSVIIDDHVIEEERSATSSIFSSVKSLVYNDYNVWNTMLEALCHSHEQNCSRVSLLVGCVMR